MKRFTQCLKRMKTEEKIGFAISVIISVVVGITLFLSYDMVPATASDYEALENQITHIQQNPDLLLKTNCNIFINDDVITVKFMNDECSMIVKYDQNFEVLSTSKEDNYIFWPFSLGLSVLGGIFVWTITYIVSLVVLYLCKFILLKFKNI